jgi:hypothetical protein
MVKEVTVEHDAPGHRFVATLTGAGEPAGILTYGVPAPGVLDFDYVEVPVGLRGRGLGDRIVAAACRYARDTGARVIPTCPYVGWWFRRHPEQSDLLGIEER